MGSITSWHKVQPVAFIEIGDPQFDESKETGPVDIESGAGVEW